MPSPFRIYGVNLLHAFLFEALIVFSCFCSLRSGRRIRKTRKYDIITTPAERVEMAPLNEENDDEDDSTLFDVKYRLVCFTGDCNTTYLGFIGLIFAL